MKKRDLYWVTTPQNEENWFVVASSKANAENFHNQAEGFDEDYSSAKFICEIPFKLLNEHHKINDEDWPNHELLQELGFNLIEDDFPRIVLFNGKLFYEGKGNLKIIENIASKYCGLYVINASGTDRYKIGFTKDLKSRLRSFRTAMPTKVDLIFYVWTTDYVYLEKLLHNDFKEMRVRGEWFKFGNDDLHILKSILQDLDKKNFHFINIKSIFEGTS